HERPQRGTARLAQLVIAPRRIRGAGETLPGLWRAPRRATQFGGVDIGDAYAFGAAADRVAIVDGDGGAGERGGEEEGHGLLIGRHAAILSGVVHLLQAGDRLQTFLVVIGIPEYQTRSLPFSSEIL